MKAVITSIRPFDSHCRIKLSSIDIQNEDGETFGVIVSADTAHVVLEPLLHSGEIIDVPDWALTIWPLYFDPDD